MNLQSLLNTHLGVGLAYGLARCLTPERGYRTAERVADRIGALRRTGLIRGMRLNHWMVGGGAVTSAQLDAAVRETLRNTGYCLYDFYHHLREPEALLGMVRFDERVLALLERIREGRHGVVLGAVHLSNFDLAARAAAQQGVKFQILSANNTGGGYQRQDRLRHSANLESTQVSIQTMYQAVQRIEAGGAVVTGVDRPLPGSAYRPRFFGRATPLPAHHIYLALRVRVPVAVIAVNRMPDHTYRVMTSDLVSMEDHGDRHTAIERNAEKVLEVAAEFIRAAPRQWSMFYPVWPDAEPEMLAALKHEDARHGSHGVCRQSCG